MKHTSVLLSALLALTLTACLGHAQPPPGGPPPPPPAGGPPPPDPNGPPPPPPPAGAPYTAGAGGPAQGVQSGYSRRGTIKAFNVGPEGETNGFILNDGTVILFPPDSGPQMMAAVREGSRIQYSGYGRTVPSGRMIVDAQYITANGQTFTMPAGPGAVPPPPPVGPPPPPGGRGRGGAPPPGGLGPGGPPPPPPNLP